MRKHAIIILLLAHVLVLGGLFTYRYPPAEARTRMDAFEHGDFRGNLLRLYMSRSPEYLWFEWSWLVLGRPLPADYPVSYREQFELGAQLRDSPRALLPYRDIPFSYPPLLMVPLLAAGLLSIGPLSYLFVFGLLCTAAWLLALRYCYDIWRLLPATQRVPWARVLALSLLMLLGIGQIAVTRLDAFVALAVTGTIAAHLRGRPLRAALWLASGVLLKLTPILLAPLLLADLLRAGQRRRALHAGLLAVGIVACVLGATALLAGKGAFQPLLEHQARPLQLESTWATVLLLAHAWANVPVHTFVAFGSWNIEGSTVLEWLAGWFPWLAIGGVYVAYWLKPSNALRLVRAAVLVQLTFMLTFRVFSPQYLLWLLPLVLITTTDRRLHRLLLMALVLTQVIWPNFYELLERASTAGAVLLAARNLLLLAVLCWLVRLMWVPPSVDRAEARDRPVDTEPRYAGERAL